MSELTALLLSRLQFAFTISFHIIFPSFSIGLAAWLALLETLHVTTGLGVYRRLFQFWLKIFAIAFTMGVVSGIVMAFQFGTNWSELSRRVGPIQGPLLSYEAFTAFALEAGFFGILLFGRQRVSRRSYLFSTLMVALGTTLSAFWIMVNNSWMQAPVGYTTIAGVFEPVDWTRIIFNPVVWVRFPHMLLASYLTGAFCVAATGAWYLRRGVHREEGMTMVRMGLLLGSVLLPAQILFGHLNGDYVHRLQPAKFAAIEGRWHDEQPASEVIVAIPDQAHERNRYELSVPLLGSVVATMSLDSKEVGLTDFPVEDRPPVAVPFWSFRIMTACGLWLLALAWVGSALLRREPGRHPLLLTLTFWSFPLPFLAILTGWFTAEVGRQPWTVYGLLRTSEGLTPSLTAGAAGSSLLLFTLVYAGIFAAGIYYINRMLHAGPTQVALPGPAAAAAAPGVQS